MSPLERQSHLLSATNVRNAAWSLANVRDHYSYLNPHADLYRYLSQWSDLDRYLNVGYSKIGQWALETNTHLRLIDRVAASLLGLHSAGARASDRLLLDVASGRGGPAIYAHEKYGLKVVGVDITPFNVGRATRNSLEKKVSSHVRFILGSALDLPLSDRSFSLAWSIESPAHFPDKRAFLREICRVLKRGGVFALADLLVVDHVAMASEKNSQIYEDFLQVWDVPYLESSESYRRAMAEAGLELRGSEIITRNNLRILEQYCGIFLLLNRIPPLYEAYKGYIRCRTGADLGNVYEHVLKSYRALRLGMIDYGLFWAVRR